MSKTLTLGDKGDAVRVVQASTNKRLRARDLDTLVVAEDGELGPKTLVAVRKAAWALGALPHVYEYVTKGKKISPDVQDLIRNPGKRNSAQLERARGRIAKMRADRKRREAEAAKAGAKRKLVVKFAKQAAANYRKNPGAYHYLAGGVANTTFLEPTPRSWRSDCSQFVASVYKAAGLPSPASVPHEWASTHTMTKSPHARITTKPRPGDLGMYGDRSGPLAQRSTHHVELYCGEPEFIGHGSPPIDSLTPGRPDFYITFDFLDN